MENFKKVYIVLFFVLGALISNLIGFRSIIRFICLLLPFALISILISFFGSYEGFKLENFAPVFGHNFYQTFVTGSINIFSMYIIGYLYILKPLLKDTSNFKVVSITSYIISWFLLFITVISILAFLGSRNPTEGINFLYMLSRDIELRLLYSKSRCTIYFTMDFIYLLLFKYKCLYSKSNTKKSLSCS